MSDRSENQLELSIWRPARIDRGYLYGVSEAGKEGIFVPVDNDRLLEQVYAWNTGSNDILGSCSQKVSQKIREKLVEPFASGELPEKRTVHHFLDMVNEILLDQTIQGDMLWTDCPETVKLQGDNEVNLRANVTLAALRHFQWIGSMFLDVPRASVLIR